MRFPVHQEVSLRLANDRTEMLRDHDQLGGGQVQDPQGHLLDSVPSMGLRGLNWVIVPMAIA